MYRHHFDESVHIAFYGRLREYIRFHPERHIGHEVFGREISYNTAADPVVRNAASETRKRLKQYDAEHGSVEPVHIMLAPGAYALDFWFSEPSVQREEVSNSKVSTAAPGGETAPISQPAHAPKSIDRRSPWLAYGIAIIATVCAVALAVALLQHKETARKVARVPDPLWGRCSPPVKRSSSL